MRHYLPTKDYLDANCLDGIRIELMFPIMLERPGLGHAKITRIMLPTPIWSLMVPARMVSRQSSPASSTRQSGPPTPLLVLMASL